MTSPCETAIVTGAAAGIGRAVTMALVEAGARVAAIDIDERGLSTLPSDRVVTIAADLRDTQAAVDAMVQAWDALGPVEGLVNSAGIYPVTPLLELGVDEWDAVLELNLRAPFVLGRELARRMVDAGVAGRIVNISSSAATLCRPGVAHYGASKAGLNQLTRDMALELAPHNIRVNAVAPGLVATDTVIRHAKGAGQAEHEAKLARIPVGREAQPAEIVPLVLMLLSSASSYCTGSIVPVDGGVTLGIPRY